MIRAAILLGALLVLTAGCAIAPPPDLLLDPTFASLGEPLPPRAHWKAPPLAVAPVTLGYLRVEDSAHDVAEHPYTWWKPPLDGRALQARTAAVLSWALYGGRSVAEIDAGSIARIETATLCAAADEKHAQLLAQVDVVEDRVTWVRRDGFMWWVDLFLVCGVGVFPLAFYPDEVYECSVTARVTVVHARTGRVLLQHDYTGSHAASLNNPQRGWSISGLIGLHPYLLTPDEGDYGRVHAQLGPHARKELEREIAAGLRASLPEALERPESRKVLAEGTEETARTYAIVVGHDGPRSSEDRARLRFAENDAEAMGEWLLESRTLDSKDHRRVLVNTDATPERIAAAIAELAPRLLRFDRLIFYYAGYGTTDPNGAPVLVLGGGEDALPVADFAALVRRALVDDGNMPRVVFLLDTSFGPGTGPGRTYRTRAQPGGPPPAAIGYLDALGRKDLAWCVIAAAGPSETAYEIDAQTTAARHGFFTACLLAGLRGKADASPRDGFVKTDELAAFLAEQVPESVRPVEHAEQTPERRGTEEPIIVGVVPRTPR